jgi:hypothetical protein
VELCEESAAVAQQAEMPFRVVWALAHQGRATLYLGRHGHAARLCRQALSVARQSNDRNAAVPQCLEVLASGFLGRRPRSAVTLFSAAEALRRGYDGTITTWFDHPECAANLAAARAALDPSDFEAAWAEGQAMTAQRAVEHALAQPVEA